MAVTGGPHACLRLRYRMLARRRTVGHNSSALASAAPRQHCRGHTPAARRPRSPWTCPCRPRPSRSGNSPCSQVPAAWPVGTRMHVPPQPGTDLPPTADS